MGVFKDSKGNVVKAGDRIKIIHNHNFFFENGKVAVVIWNEKKGKYEYEIIDHGKVFYYSPPDDFDGISEFELIKT